jgi:hypothetical protein
MRKETRQDGSFAWKEVVYHSGRESPKRHSTSFFPLLLALGRFDDGFFLGEIVPFLF